MSILIVVSHPDDEVLGCGAMAAELAARGHEVRSCILSGQVGARQHRPSVLDLHSDLRESHRILGIGEAILGDFPNIAFNTVPHLELVQFIEKAMVQTDADILLTHHPQDLNNDHLHTSIACQAAARLAQRSNRGPRLKALYFMEILSSTDWAFPGPANLFTPDTYFELGEQRLSQKCDALQAYRNVMRDYPHPRSLENVRALATLRGGQAGMRYAESFQTAFHAWGFAERSH